MRRQRRRAELPGEILSQASLLDEQGVNSEPVDGRSVSVITLIRSDVDDSPGIQPDPTKHDLEWRSGPNTLANISRRSLFIGMLVERDENLVNLFHLADRYFKHQKVFPFSIYTEEESIVGVEYYQDFANAFSVEMIEARLRFEVEWSAQNHQERLDFDKVAIWLGFYTRFRAYRSAKTEIPNAVRDESKFFRGGIVSCDTEDSKVFCLEQLLKMVHVITSMYRGLEYYQTITSQYEKFKLDKEGWYDLIEFDKNNPFFGYFFIKKLDEQGLNDCLEYYNIHFALVRDLVKELFPLLELNALV